MKTEITIEAVKQDNDEHCEGCIFDDICNGYTAQAVDRLLLNCDIPECTDGYIYKIKQGVETKD